MSRSCPTQIIRQRPCQNKTHHPAQHIPRPEVRPLIVEVLCRFAVRGAESYQDGDKECCDEVEDKAVERLQAESTGSEPEEG